MLNAKTKKYYTQGNEEKLVEAAAMCGFQSEEWATFIQWKEQGAKVKKGEKGTELMRVVEKKVKNKETGKLEKQKLVKRFYVFNKEQVEVGA